MKRTEELKSIEAVESYSLNTRKRNVNVNEFSGKYNERKVFAKEESRMEGITLIALVITIIVILLLAGVSITMISGNNGVLTKVGEASEAQKDAEEDEEVKMAVITAIASDDLGKLTDSNLREAIKNEFGSSDGLAGTGPWVYTGKRNKYDIDGNGNVAEHDIITEMRIGDYVNYTYDISENYTYEIETYNITFDIEQTPNLEWRIININNDNITLASSTTTQNPLNLGSVYSYSTEALLAQFDVLIDVLNNSCKELYSNSTFSANARSIEYSDYNDENKEILNNMENEFFYATICERESFSRCLWIGRYYDGGEPVETAVCYDNSRDNQTSGSTRSAYILPVVKINKSYFDSKQNDIWQLKN